MRAATRYRYPAGETVRPGSGSPVGIRLCFPGLGYRRTAAAWPGLTNLDCGVLWKGEYFATESPTGQPAMVRCDERIDFDWEDGSAPWVAMRPNGFSVRWTGSANLAEAGAYTFTTFTDDGVRLWFDDEKIIDEWRPQHDKHEKDVTVEEGEHSIKMEFYNGAGGAVARLSWDKVEPTPTPTPKPSPTPTATKRPTAPPRLHPFPPIWLSPRSRGSPRASPRAMRLGHGA